VHLPEGVRKKKKKGRLRGMKCPPFTASRKKKKPRPFTSILRRGKKGKDDPPSRLPEKEKEEEKGPFLTRGREDEERGKEREEGGRRRPTSPSTSIGANPFHFLCGGKMRGEEYPFSTLLLEKRGRENVETFPLLMGGKRKKKGR